jgi:hypothetical protein
VCPAVRGMSSNSGCLVKRVVCICQTLILLLFLLIYLSSSDIVIFFCCIETASC